MVVVKARVVDSTHLELSEPIATQEGATVLVLLSMPEDRDEETVEWAAASLNALRDAYGDEEPEYLPSMVREKNPEYRP